MSEVASYAASMASAVHEQQVATSEISRNIAHVSEDAAAVLENIEAVGSVTRQASSVASDVASSTAAVNDTAISSGRGSSSSRSRLGGLTQQVRLRSASGTAPSGQG